MKNIDFSNYVQVLVLLFESVFDTMSITNMKKKAHISLRSKSSPSMLPNNRTLVYLCKTGLMPSCQSKVSLTQDYIALSHWDW